MTIAQPITPLRLTYEDYMAEGEVYERYDILDGVRLVTNPTRRHQRILRNLVAPFIACETAGHGQCAIAPCDILIRRAPLRTRQPDLLFMSSACVAQNPSADDPAPLNPAPELIVETVSPSDTRAVLADKLADYQRVHVREAWLIYSGTQMVEVLTLTLTGIGSTATYTTGQTVQSTVFPGLSVSVDAIFAA